MDPEVLRAPDRLSDQILRMTEVGCLVCVYQPHLAQCYSRSRRIALMLHTSLILERLESQFLTI